MIFGDSVAGLCEPGLRGVLENLDLGGTNFEAVMEDLREYMEAREATCLYTLRDGQRCRVLLPHARGQAVVE